MLSPINAGEINMRTPPVSPITHIPTPYLTPEIDTRKSFDDTWLVVLVHSLLGVDGRPVLDNGADQNHGTPY